MFANKQNYILSSNLEIKKEDGTISKIGSDSKVLDYNGFKIGLIGATSTRTAFNSNISYAKNIITKNEEETANRINTVAQTLKERGVSKINVISSLYANTNKNDPNKLITSSFDEGETTKVVNLLSDNIDSLVVNNFSKPFNLEVANNNQKNINVISPKSNGRGFVRYQYSLNRDNILLESQIVNEEKLSTSGDEKGIGFTSIDDLLNQQTNADYNENLKQLHDDIQLFKSGKYNEIRNQILIQNNENSLLSSNTRASSLGSYLVDLIADNYEFSTSYNKQNNQWTFAKVDGVLINSRSIASSFSVNHPIRRGKILEILPYSNYFISGEIKVSEIKREILKDKNGQIQFNDKFKIQYTENEQGVKSIVSFKIRNENNEYVEADDNTVLRIAIPNFMYFSRDYNFLRSLKKRNDHDHTNIRDIVINLMKKTQGIDSKYNDESFKLNDKRFEKYVQPTEIINEPSNEVRSDDSIDTSNDNASNNNENPNSLNDNQNNNPGASNNDQEEPQTTSQNNKLRIGHWNVLHQSGKDILKNEALARIILFNKYDVVGLTEINPTTDNQNQEESDLPLKSIVDLLNQYSNSHNYSFVVSSNLEGVENASLSTNQHTSTERIGVIYNNKKVKPKAFANGEIGHVYSNNLKEGKFTGEPVDYSRPPYAIKLESILDIKNDFTLVLAHFDSPGYRKGPKKENSVTKKELSDMGLITNNSQSSKNPQGSREADNADHLIDVINEVLTLDNNSDDDLFFMGDTNIYLGNEHWAFKTFVESGFANMLSDSDEHKSSLSTKVGQYANPYDKLYKKTDLDATNPSIYNIWNVYEDMILNDDWVVEVRSKNIRNKTRAREEFIRTTISDHAPTYFDLILNPDDQK